MSIFINRREPQSLGILGIRDDFVPHLVETNHRRNLCLVVVVGPESVTNSILELFYGVRLCEDTFTKGMRCQAPFRIILNEENDLALLHHDSIIANFAPGRTKPSGTCCFWSLGDPASPPFGR